MTLDAIRIRGARHFLDRMHKREGKTGGSGAGPMSVPFTVLAALSSR